MLRRWMCGVHNGRNSIQEPPYSHSLHHASFTYFAKYQSKQINVIDGNWTDVYIILPAKWSVISSSAVAL